MPLAPVKDLFPFPWDDITAGRVIIAQLDSLSHCWMAKGGTTVKVLTVLYLSVRSLRSASTNLGHTILAFDYGRAELSVLGPKARSIPFERILQVEFEELDVRLVLESDELTYDAILSPRWHLIDWREQRDRRDDVLHQGLQQPHPAPW